VHVRSVARDGPQRRSLASRTARGAWTGPERQALLGDPRKRGAFPGASPVAGCHATPCRVALVLPVRGRIPSGSTSSEFFERMAPRPWASGDGTPLAQRVPQRFLREAPAFCSQKRFSTVQLGSGNGLCSVPDANRHMRGTGRGTTAPRGPTCARFGNLGGGFS
jgi:hypothetical protein